MKKTREFLKYFLQNLFHEKLKLCDTTMNDKVKLLVFENLRVHIQKKVRGRKLPVHGRKLRVHGRKNEGWVMVRRKRRRRTMRNALIKNNKIK